MGALPRVLCVERTVEHGTSGEWGEGGEGEWERELTGVGRDRRGGAGGGGGGERGEAVGALPRVLCVERTVENEIGRAHV